LREEYPKEACVHLLRIVEQSLDGLNLPGPKSERVINLVVSRGPVQLKIRAASSPS
jgi:hypothetical protein